MSKVKIQGHSSGSGTVTITAPNTNSDRTLTIPDITGTAITSGDTGTVTQAIVHPDAVNKFISGRKNLIINGGMDVWQRGVNFGSVLGYTADRWERYTGTTTLLQRSSNVPDIAAGFRYSMHITTGSSSGGNEKFRSQQEDTGTLYPQGTQLTISAYVKVVSGSISLDLGDSANCTSGVTGGGWVRISGTTTSRNITSYPGHDFIDIAIPDNSDVYITGIQLELGDQATEFEHRSYGEELALCQRYFYPIITSASAVQAIGQGVYWTSTVCHVNVQLPTTMRDIPTLTATSGVAFTSYYGGTATNITFSSQGVASTNTHLELTFSGVPQGNVFIRGRYNTSFIFADAEL
jgi:hypothetical protein